MPASPTTLPTVRRSVPTRAVAVVEADEIVLRDAESLTERPGCGVTAGQSARYTYSYVRSRLCSSRIMPNSVL
jgi:hypothetical protein